MRMIFTVYTLVPNVVWIVASGVFLTAGDIVMRFFLASHRASLCGGAFVLYMCGIGAMMMSFFGKDIAVASVLAVVVNAVTLLLVNALYFHEPLSGMGYVGIGVACVAICILELYA